MDKITWTLTREHDADQREFQQFVLQELAPTAGQCVSSTAEVRVTLQDPSAYSRAFVDLGDGERPVDVALELLATGSYVALDDADAYLQAQCGHVQGWRVRPNLIYDASTPVALGEPSAFPNILCFVERLDGTTAEHFDRNWSIHAGHLDGRQAESEASRAERRREEESSPGQLYRQNRVVEPVTPTAWLIHGYTQLQFAFLLPSVGDAPYASAGRGTVRPVATANPARPRTPDRVNRMSVLRGGIAVVTGGAGTAAGLGRGLVRGLAREGMRVAMLDVDRDAAATVEAELRVEGLDTLACGVDVTDEQSLQLAADHVRDVYGGCNVLCAHVGGGGQGRFEDCTLDAWRAALELMVVGTVATVQAFLPLIARLPGHRQRRADLVAATLAPDGSQGPYRAAKAAVTSIGETSISSSDRKASVPPSSSQRMLSPDLLDLVRSADAPDPRRWIPWWPPSPRR